MTGGPGTVDPEEDEPDFGQGGSRSPRYGLDALDRVGTFVGSGLVLAVALAAALAWIDVHRPWFATLAAGIAIGAVYLVATGILILQDSLTRAACWPDEVLDTIRWRGDEIVLDVGCGRGALSVGAARRLVGGRTVAVESAARLEQLSRSAHGPRANAEREGVDERVDLRAVELRSLPFGDGLFDVVMTSRLSGRHRTREARADALGEMVRVLRPGGTLLVHDIARHREYLEVLGRHGFLEGRHVVHASRVRDRLLGLVSFGTCRPATLIARAPGKPRSPGSSGTRGRRLRVS